MNRNNIRIHNFFVATLKNVVTGEEKKYFAENIVLDCYFSYILRLGNVAYTLDSILVGTGTGELSPTRTTLFHQVGYHYDLPESECVLTSPNSLKRVLSTVFTETEVNGDLTEVGIGRHGSLVTHAFFTDSEQNPIVITKTSTDRLTIEATYYVEWDLDSSVDWNSIPVWGSGSRPHLVMNTSEDAAHQAQLATITGSATNTCIGNAVSGRINSMFSRDSGSFNRTEIDISLLTKMIPDSSAVGEFGRFPFTLLCTMYYDQQTGLIRAVQNGQINSDTDNLNRTYQIKSLVYGNYFAIPLPNHDLYPPKLLTFTLVSDGGTDYNLGIPILSTSGVEVTVDGVVQDPSTYTFNGKDFTFKQAWVSADNTYISKCDVVAQNYSGSTRARPLPFTIPVSSTNYEWVDSEGNEPSFVYDFGSPIAVDTFASAYTGSLFYSNDGSTWTQAAVISSNTNPETVVTFPEVSARYWKTTISKSISRWASGQDNYFTLVSEFDKVTPQLKFNTAPSADAVIQVKAYTEYPVKNSNWIINQSVIDWYIRRGTTP